MATLPGLRVGLTLDSATFIRETRRVNSAVDRMSGDVNRQTGVVAGGFGRINSAIGAAKTAIIGLGAGVGIAGLVSLGKQIVGTADQYTNLTSRIRLAIGEQENLALVQERLLSLSQATRQDLSTTSEIFARLALGMRESGTSANELLKITESLAQAIAISGANTTEASAGLLQFSQAMSSGVLRGEELNSILDQIPRLAQAIAAGMDVPIGKLRELGKEGELTTEVVLAALRSQAPALAEEFAKVPITVAGAMTQVRNSFTQLIGDTEKATGSTQALAESLSNLATTIGSTGFRAGFQDFLAEGVDRINTTIKEFQRLKTFIEGIPASFVEMKDKSLAAVEAMVAGVEQEIGRRLKSTLLDIINPIGAVTEGFKRMFINVVEESFVPDMVDGIEREFARLNRVMVDPTEQATANVSMKFERMANSLTNAVNGISAIIMNFSTDGTAALQGLSTQLLAIGQQLNTGFNLNLAGPLAAAGLGGAIGGLGGQLAFGRGGGIGGALGGALGAGVGTFFGGPVGGLVGGTLGSVAGSFLGGLFGGGDEDKVQGAFSGPLGRASFRGDREISNIVRKVDESILGLLDSRQEALAAKLRLPRFSLSVKGGLSESDIESITSARVGPIAEALGFRRGAVLRGDAEQAIQNLQTALQTQRAIDALTGSVTEFERQADDLANQFEQLEAQARRFGISIDGLAEAQADAARDLRRQQDAQVAALLTPFEALSAPLEAFQRDLEFAQLNPAQQFARAQEEFNRIAAEAAAGSIPAIQQLQQAGQLFINLAGQVGASPGQAAAVEQVSTAVEEVLARVEASQQEASEAFVDAINRNRVETVDTLQELIEATNEGLRRLERAVREG